MMNRTDGIEKNHPPTGNLGAVSDDACLSTLMTDLTNMNDRRESKRTPKLLVRGRLVWRWSASRMSRS